MIESGYNKKVTIIIKTGIKKQLKNIDIWIKWDDH